MCTVTYAVEHHQLMCAYFHLPLPFYSLLCVSAEVVFTLSIGQNIKPCWRSDSLCLHNMAK